jgi:hypothetical protein
MPKKRYTPEEIIAKLRQVDVLVSQGQNIADAIPASAYPMQRAICCRIFTPAALPVYPAASLRDYCSGVLRRVGPKATGAPQQTTSLFDHVGGAGQTDGHSYTKTASRRSLRNPIKCCDQAAAREAERLFVLR